MRKAKKEVIYTDVEIIDAVSEGMALARVENKVVFVPFVVPGDVVDIQVYKKKKNYMEGFIKRIVKPDSCAQHNFIFGCA